MDVLLAPDKFAGTLTAQQAIDAIARGWSAVRPIDTVSGLPLSDGGPGFLDAVDATGGGRRSTVQVRGPRGAPAAAEILFRGSGAFIESAQACGLHLVPAQRRDPGGCTTAGVGDLIRQAVAAGVRSITVGLGGSATTDGGAGALAALGARAVDEFDRDATSALLAGGAGLQRLAAVDLRPVRALLSGVQVEVAGDVAAPLHGPQGAARGYAPQKGAGAAGVERLEAAMAHWAQLLAAAGSASAPQDPGAGAAGGLGFGLMAVGGRWVSGMDLVAGLADLPARCRAVDAVITGEGRLDWQSAQGKVVSGVLRAAADSGTPVLVVAGSSSMSDDEAVGFGIRDLATASDAAGSDAAALSEPGRWVAAAASRLACRFEERSRDEDG